MNFSTNNPYFKQVQLLVRVLPYINNYKCFGLKGGTAINMFLRNLPRLSVDIDLVYLPLKERADALIEINSSLLQLAADIEKSKLAKVYIQNTRQKLLVQGLEVQVKIEVSLTRGHLLPVQKVNACDVIMESIGAVEICILNEREVYASKLCAALSRQHPRDLFDVKMLLEDGLINEGLIDVFIIYLMSANRPMVELLDPNFKDLSAIYENHFRGMTLQSVDLSALEQARSDLLKKLRKHLNEKHKKQLLDFKKGTIDWEKFAYPDAQALPAVKWKQENLKKMSSPKRLAAINKLESYLNGI